MYYFIPAWYHPEGDWDYPNVSNHFKVSRFDDAVNHIQLFKNNHQDFQVLLLNYQPYLRTFLHDQALDGIDYFSVFDWIQDIPLKNTVPFDLFKLAWPANSEFIYNPFGLVVEMGTSGRVLVRHSSAGLVSQMTYQGLDNQDQEYIIDDRGFISSVLAYQDGQPRYQDFLNLVGDWVIRLDLESGLVWVNPQYRGRFYQDAYPSMTDLIQEVLDRHQQANKQAVSATIISADSRHNHLLSRVFNHNFRVLSLTQARNGGASHSEMKDWLDQADLFICDQTNVQENLLAVGAGKPVHTITPFDTRLALGMSQRKKELIIFWAIDGLTLAQIEDLVGCFLAYKHKESRLQVQLATANQEPAYLAQIQEIIDQGLASLSPQLMDQVVGMEDFQDKLPDQEEEDFLQLLVIENEQSIIKGLQYARLIVDLADQPSQYLQIAGISSGIPQINKQDSDLVAHKENGYIIDRNQDIDQALDYYFVNLKHWNQSLVHSVNRINRYYSGELMAQWQTYIEEGKNEPVSSSHPRNW